MNSDAIESPLNKLMFTGFLLGLTIQIYVYEEHFWLELYGQSNIKVSGKF